MKQTLTYGNAAFEIAQTPLDLEYAEHVLRTYIPTRLVELGTWHYGFCAFVRHFDPVCEIITFDHIVRPLTPDQQAFLGSEQKFHAYRADIHNEPWLIAGILREEPHGRGRTLLICDAGHRGLLAQQYARWLRIGDVIAIHDWGTAGIGPSAVGHALDGFTRIPLPPHLAERVRTECARDNKALLVRYWVRTAIPQEISS